MKSFPALATSLLCLVFSPAASLLAQAAAPAPYRFPAAAQAVLDRLASFQSLPADTWQYHLGDIPHGEQPGLDTRDWQTIHIPYQSGEDTIWLRRTVEMPPSLRGYSLAGAELWLQIKGYANGPVPMILYLNGRRVALGDNLEAQPLDLRPGEKVLVAVKFLGTRDKKNIGTAQLEVRFPTGRPNPEDLRKELESAVHLLPCLPQNSATLVTQEKLLDAAAETVNLAALDRNDAAAFDRSLQQAQSKLDPLRPVLQQYTIHMAGNAHIDAAWLWPWTETVDVVRRTFSSALQLMEEYPGTTYTQSAAQYYEWMQQKYPSIFHEIQQRVKEGRWEIVGGMWVEPDLNLPDGESNVRQILVAKRYFEKNFGVDVRIGWNPDTFGYNWQMPQVYKKSGIDYFVTQKMFWNDTNKLPLKLFWWQSPDGSRVLTYFPHDYVNPIEPVPMATDLAQAIQLNPGQHEMLHLYGVGDHGGGPTRDMLDSGVRWMQPDKVFPRLEFGTAQSFFTAMDSRIEPGGSPVWNYETLAAHNTALPPAHAGRISLPVWNDELYLEYHRGTYTTQAMQKWNLRHGSQDLLNAEKYASLDWLGGAEYPGDKLTEAWKLQLFNGFHDLAAGSGIGQIYKDAQQQFDAVRATTDQATRMALADIESQISTGASAGVPIILWNTLSWKRTGIAEAEVQMPHPSATGISVLDANGRRVPVQILSHDAATSRFRLLLKVSDVPSIGYTVLHAVPGARPMATDLHPSGTTLENSLLRIAIDPKNGCITSLYDKRSHFESIASGGCGNQLQAFVDTPREYDAWNIDANFTAHETDLTMADSVQLVEAGPVRDVVRITRHWNQSRFTQDIILYAGMPRVDVVNDVDWHETHILLKAAFPLAASGSTAAFEIPYGSIERPTSRNNSVEQAKFEVPAQRWADLGDGRHGFSLINDSKYGYDAIGNVLRLSLLRSPVWPDPDADRGPQHFRYSLYPHAGTWREAQTVLRAREFNDGFLTSQAEAHTGELPPTHSFVSVAPENLVLTAMKKSEDGNALILRFYEWAGKQTTAELHLPSGATAASAASLMEHPEGAALAITGNRVSLPVGPYSIDTVRVEFGHRGQNFWQAAGK